MSISDIITKIDTAEMLDPKGKNSHGPKNNHGGEKQKTPPPPSQPRYLLQPQNDTSSRALHVPTAASHQHTQSSTTSSSQPLYVSTSPVSNSSPIQPSPQKIPSPKDISQREHPSNYNYHPFNNTTKTDSSSSSSVKGGMKTINAAKQRLEMMKTAPHDLSDLQNDFYHKNATQYSTDQFAK